MPGRFFLLLAFLPAALGGCASVSEERLSMLESAVLDLQIRDMRLSSLEETVAALVARTPLPAAEAPDPETSPDLTTKPGPRKVMPEPKRAAAPPPPLSSVPDEYAFSAHSPGTPEAASPAPAPAPQPVPALVPASKPAQVKPKNPAQAAKLYKAALSAFEAGRPEAALGQFQDFLRDYPDHVLAPNAGYWLGECYYTRKQYESAILAFKDVVALHPHHDKAAAAMLKAGYSYALLDDAANARFYLEALVKDFPSSQPASLARTRLASL